MQGSLQIENSCNGVRYRSQISGIEKPKLNKRTLEITDSIVDSYDVEDETSLDRSSPLTDDRFKRPIPSNYYNQPAPVENDMWSILEKTSPGRSSFWKMFFLKPFLQLKNLKFKGKPNPRPTTKTWKTTTTKKWRYTTKRSEGSYGSDNNIDINVDVEIHKEPTNPEEEFTVYEYHPLTSHLTHKPQNFLSFQPVR